MKRLLLFAVVAVLALPALPGVVNSPIVQEELRLVTIGEGFTWDINGSIPNFEQVLIEIKPQPSGEPEIFITLGSETRPVSPRFMKDLPLLWGLIRTKFPDAPGWQGDAPAPSEDIAALDAVLAEIKAAALLTQ